MSCPGGTVGSCYAAAWAQRVVDNGGAAPSQTTVDAAATFFDTLVSQSLLSKIKNLNFIAPDSLIAAKTPFIKRTGYDLWSDISVTPLTAAQLTVNGIIGISGWNNAWDTGFDPNAGFTSWTNSGLTINVVTDPGAGVTYVHFSSNNGVVTHGIWDTAGDKWGIPGGGGVIKAAHTIPGYYSANRRANNDCYLYYATGATAHASLGSNLGVVAGGLPAKTTYFMALNNNGTKAFNSLSRLSFAAQHEGFTAAESLAFFNAMQALRVGLGGGFIPDPTSPQQIAVDWASRVVKNGGALPSATSITAAQTFLTSLSSAGLLTKIKALNFFAPDSLTAAITPLIKGVGLDPWTNNLFVAGDLTVNGLKGDGSTKLLLSGVYMSSLNESDYGFTVYSSEVENTASVEMGTWIGSTGFDLQVLSAGNTKFDASYIAATGRIDVANAGFAGYVSGNRIAANDQRIFTANSTSGHGQLGATNSNVIADQRGAMIGSLYVFGNYDTPPAPLWSKKRLSFAAMHDGLTQAQSLSLYTAVQALRTTLGGGYV